MFFNWFVLFVFVRKNSTCKLSLSIDILGFLRLQGTDVGIDVNGFAGFHEWPGDVPASVSCILKLLSLITPLFIHFAGQSTDTPRGTRWAGKCSPAVDPSVAGAGALAPGTHGDTRGWGVWAAGPWAVVQQLSVRIRQVSLPFIAVQLQPLPFFLVLRKRP